MWYVYILQGDERARKYIGYTGNVEARIVKHNCGGVKSTKAYRPWRLVHKEIFKNKVDARKREIFLKRNARARKDLFQLIDGEAPIVAEKL